LAQIADRNVDNALALLSAREREQFSEGMRRVKRQLQAMLEPELAAASEVPRNSLGDPAAPENHSFAARRGSGSCWH